MFKTALPSAGPTARWPRRAWWAMALVVVGLVFVGLGAADEADEAGNRLAADKSALAVLKDYVGQWKGVGQVRRGSSQGAWTEQADWAWEFSEGRAAITFESPDARYYRRGRITPGDESGTFTLSAARPQEGDAAAAVDRFSGGLNDQGHLVLVASPDDEGEDGPPVAERISVRLVAGGDRLVVLYEKRAGGERYRRLAEVGATRVGSKFAKGSSQPECVVTGGLGTIEVSYEGREYYVCCSGCRDLFNDDPAGVLAEYHERRAEEKRRRESEDSEGGEP